MIKLAEEQKNKFQALAGEFEEKYLNTKQGKNHLQHYEEERKEVKQVFDEIKAKFAKGEDITEDVLRHLLPHSDTKHTRERGYHERSST